MKRRHSGLACAAALIATTAGVALDASPVSATTRTVSTLADVIDGGDGELSLREAITASNFNDTITLPAGTYTLQCTNGDLDMNRGLTMSGPASGDPAIITINPACGQRVINISAADFAPMLIENVTISGGRETRNFFGGGGLFVSGPSLTTLRNVTIEDNEAGPNGDGGGIRAQTALRLENVTMLNNRAGDGTTNNSGGDGGAIAMLTGSTAAPLTVIDSVIGSVAQPNRSGSGAGVGNAGSGGGISTDGKFDLTIIRTTIDGNRLGNGEGAVEGRNAAGGGVAVRSFVAAGGATTITDSRIINNRGGSGLLGGGGGAWLASLDVDITGTLIESNVVPTPAPDTDGGHGGGVAITPGFVEEPLDVTLTGNTIRNNSIAATAPSTGTFGRAGGNGGGVYIDADSGIALLVDNTFDGNQAGDNNVGTGLSGSPAGGGGNLYVSMVANSIGPTPGSITVRGGVIRNGTSGGGTTGTAGWGGGAHLISGSGLQGGTIVIEDVEITGNSTKATTQGGIGGGVFARSFAGMGQAGSITVDGVTASDNSTASAALESASSGGTGGAMYLEAVGLADEPTVTITQSTFTDNATGDGATTSNTFGGFGGDGGAVYVSATALDVNGTTFSNNAAGDGGNGLTTGGRGGRGGGLLMNSGALTMTSTTFTGNSTGDGGASSTSSGGASGSGGGFFANTGGAVSVSNSTFRDNRIGSGGAGQTQGGSGGDGGGFGVNQSVSDAGVSITSTTVDANSAGNGGAGTTSRSGVGGNGGGISIEVDGGDVTLNDVSVIDNDAGDGAAATAATGTDARGGFGGDGGGVYISDSEHRSAVSVSQSTVADNTAGDAGSSVASDAGLAGDGGGIFVGIADLAPNPAGFGTFRLERSTISGNVGGTGASGAGASTAGGAGGGAYLVVGSTSGPEVIVERSTIHANSGGAEGSGSRPGDGGGIFIADGSGGSTFDHVTITDNDGLNGVNLLTRASSNVFTATVIGEKSDRDLENCNAIGVTMTSNGFNVEASEGGFSCQFDEDTDLEVASPGLAPLADNGGSTLTRLPLFNSPLIDVRPCAATTDQRGVSAPLGAACDVGSTESDFAEVLITTDPARFVDTRSIGDTVDGQFEGDGRRDAGKKYEVQIAGRGDVPDDAVGAILNVTAVGATSNGFVTVYPCLPEPPLASSLNHTAGVNLGNEIIAGLDSSGAMCFFTAASIHLTVDVVGYIPAGSPYTPLSPARVLETRDQPGATTVDGEFEGDGRTGNGTALQLEIGGRAGVPADAAAVIMNITAVRPDARGFITVYPCGPNLPLAASLNYSAGVNRGNELVAQLDDDGELCIFTSNPIHLTVDVVGFVPAGSTVSAVFPQRLIDTRETTKPSAGAQIRLDVAKGANTAPFVPTGATAAIVNVTAVRPDARGFVTVHPCLDDPPLASSLNYVPGVNGGNELIARLSDSGELCLFTNQSTHLTVDIVGYVL